MSGGVGPMNPGMGGGILIKWKLIYFEEWKWVEEWVAVKAQ